MAWHILGDKPLSEPIMVNFTDADTRHSALMSLINVCWQLYPAQLWRVLYGQCPDISRVPRNYIRGAGTVRLDSFYPVQEATDLGLSLWSRLRKGKPWRYFASLDGKCHFVDSFSLGAPAVMNMTFSATKYENFVKMTTIPSQW